MWNLQRSTRTLPSIIDSAYVSKRSKNRFSRTRAVSVTTVEAGIRSLVCRALRKIAQFQLTIVSWEKTTTTKIIYVAVSFYRFTIVGWNGSAISRDATVTRILAFKLKFARENVPSVFPFETNCDRASRFFLRCAFVFTRRKRNATVRDRTRVCSYVLFRKRAKAYDSWLVDIVESDAKKTFPVALRGACCVLRVKVRRLLRIRLTRKGRLKDTRRKEKWSRGVRWLFAHEDDVITRSRWQLDECKSCIIYNRLPNRVYILKR